MADTHNYIFYLQHVTFLEKNCSHHKPLLGWCRGFIQNVIELLEKICSVIRRVFPLHLDDPPYLLS